MTKNRKTRPVSPRKLDPAKATLYVAVITLLSAVIVACIANFHKFRTSPQQPQAEEIITFQDHQYDNVVAELDARMSEAQEEEAMLPRRKAKNAVQLRRYIAQNRETQIAVAKKHSEFKAAIRTGDYFKANVLKSEVNEKLCKEEKLYVTRVPVKRSKQEFSLIYQAPPFLDSNGNRSAYEYLVTCGPIAPQDNIRTPQSDLKLQAPDRTASRVR